MKAPADTRDRTVGSGDGPEAVVPYELPDAAPGDPLGYGFLVLEP